MPTRQTMRTARTGIARTIVPAQSLTVMGKRLVLIEQNEYDQLRAAAGMSEVGLPPFPTPDSEGNVPAFEYARASLARKIVLARKAQGLTQGELAKRAGVRIETVNRIENGKHTPDVATIDKLQRALDAAGLPAPRRQARRAKSR